MKNIFYTVFLCLLAGYTASAQGPADLDFWLGEWNLRWQQSDSTEATGSNSITRDLNDQVICEHFHAHNGQFAGFEGKSWSMFDTRSDTWKQTWVDNQGSYLDFTGGKEGENFVFRRSFTDKEGKTLHQKMVFHDIEADRFTWDWMRSKDGKEWQLLWRVQYSRQ
ncbi:MAG: hypothetical protein H6565_07920 [Lewinellaceae bacterium]|nr:hypothetical protein [Lewinellaceae bacterium]